MVCNLSLITTTLYISGSLKWPVRLFNNANNWFDNEILHCNMHFFVVSALIQLNRIIHVSWLSGAYGYVADSRLFTFMLQTERGARFSFDWRWLGRLCSVYCSRVWCSHIPSESTVIILQWRQTERSRSTASSIPNCPGFWCMSLQMLKSSWSTSLCNPSHHCLNTHLYEYVYYCFSRIFAVGLCNSKDLI